MKPSRILFTRYLIIFGKNLPFILCFGLLFENIESLYAYYNNLWYNVNGDMILYTPISWYIYNFTKYGWTTVISLFTLSVATQCCIRHRIAIYYLAINLIEKIIVDSMSLNDMQVRFIFP